MSVTTPRTASPSVRGPHQNWASRRLREVYLSISSFMYPMEVLLLHLSYNQGRSYLSYLPKGRSHPPSHALVPRGYGRGYGQLARAERWRPKSDQGPPPSSVVCVGHPTAHTHTPQPDLDLRHLPKIPSWTGSGLALSLALVLFISAICMA